MFIDTARITVRAGRGGKGVDSFYKDKFTRKGRPDGGDGGNGGDVIIRVSTDVHTLIDFRYRHLFKAGNAAHGSSKQQRGRNGKDSIIIAPPGTLVYDIDKKILLKDLIEPGEECIVAKGGAGGKGNRSRKPATAGEDGEERGLLLELKLIADVGIIGLPNAGKSTLISRVSRARPRIASFPFTTKSPVLGVVECGDTAFTAAEIPGLIEGSHKGKGLGDKFLRHAERTKIFLHLIDLSKASTGEAAADYKKIRKELKFYEKELEQKPQVVAGNKIDIDGADKNLEALRNELNMDIHPISAKEGTGIEQLVEMLADALARVLR